MAITRWDPFAELASMRRAMDRTFDDKLLRMPWSGLGDGGEQFAIDMYQTDNDVVVKASLPGVKPEDVDITLAGDMLIIKGETRDEKEVKEESYFHKEHRYGSFSRSITLPSNLKADNAEASFENGMLTITIPKSEETKPKSIKVKAQQVLEGKK